MVGFAEFACETGTGIMPRVPGLQFALAAALIVCASVRGATAQSLSFDDEFDAPVLDTTQWVALARGGDASNGEAQCYVPTNATLADGFLNLTSQYDPSGCSTVGTNYQYSSSMVQWSSFNFLYGTLEARIKFAGGQGTWPALWLLGANCQQTNITTAENVGTCSWPNPGSDEIDVAEILNSRTTVVNQQIHSSLGNPGCNAQVSDVSENLHTYILAWVPGKLTFQIDGVTTCTLTQAVPSNPMFLMINTALGGQGGPIEPGTLPQTTYVDYVRVSPN
jgi:beta-glucanase (GH16 family)